MRFTVTQGMRWALAPSPNCYFSGTDERKVPPGEKYVGEMLNSKGANECGIIYLNVV